MNAVQPVRLGVLFLGAILATPLAAQTAAPVGPAAATRMSPPAHMPGELLVGFQPDASASDRQRLRALVGAELLETVTTEAMRQASYGEVELFRLPAGASALNASALLSRQPLVRFAEPNWIYSHDAVSNDPYYTGGSLWGMYGNATTPANSFGSQAGEAWANNHTGSSSVIVAVIDEGVQHTHQDLSANIWSNPHDPADGIDNDGNGYVDDVRGWDFAGGNNTTYDSTQDDHGTHVAGTIGARGGNGVGVAGVVWNVKIISCKFLSGSGGTTANAIRAVDYVTDLKTRHGLNIVATNNSWGGGGFSQGLFDAIARSNNANIVFCAAAGNNGTNNDSTANYPSNYTNPNIIAVASITSTGARSSFSNYGATTVDIGAPGSSIFSTLPNNAGTKYGSYSGTSMATPHVTGACALYAASNPGATAAQIKSAILGSAIPTASLSGACVTGGRLDVGGF